jgi:hypothetical protein
VWRAGGARLWTGCTPVSFAGLEANGLSLSASKLSACPLGGPLLAVDKGDGGPGSGWQVWT